MRPLVACACVVAALALAAPATAEPLPAGRVSFVGGLRTGTGSLYSSIGTGGVLGFEAAYAPLRAPQTIGLGLTWSLLWSYYGSGSARIVDSMAMVELDAGARIRMMPGPCGDGARHWRHRWLEDRCRFPEKAQPERQGLDQRPQLGKPPRPVHASRF